MTKARSSSGLLSRGCFVFGGGDRVVLLKLLLGRYLRLDLKTKKRMLLARSLVTPTQN
jgi:hypothetical protein